MPINNKKIRREVSLNGAKVWITADTEQEYADKIGADAYSKGAMGSVRYAESLT